MKKKVYIALIGGQTYPVYLGYADCCADEVILIHSEATKEEAERISAELSEKVKFLQFDPVDVEKIFKEAKLIANNLNDDCSYIVNITGGTKPWSVALYSCFNGFSNVKLIYVDQNNHIYDLSTMKSYLANIELDMDLLFRLNNTKANAIAFCEYTQEDVVCLGIIKALRYHSFDAFNLLSVLDKSSMNKVDSQNTGTMSFSTNKVSAQIDWNKELNVLKVKLVDNKGKVMEDRLKSPHVFNMFFSTGWFEFEVAKILSEWKYAKEIRLNATFPYINNSIKNEIDIIVNTGNRLLFIECKTQITNITDIDKFSTAVRNYGGMGCKALFITDAKMKDTAAEKCADSGILSFSMSDCKGSFSPSVMLFATLEQELFSINKK